MKTSILEGADCGYRRLLSGAALLVVVCASLPGWANPVGGTVTRGSATFSSQGPQLNITTSDRAFINWQSFNIGLGETARFFQPSSSSVVWNRINDLNASQILGNLTANGLVVLQNQSGFYVGGQAAINVGGLVMTTAPTMPSDFMSGGMWQFNGPPPTASVINYGQIHASSGGSVFLIARDIENHGTITAPAGRVGLYAGQEVLVSQSPDGRGLAARVRLPEGSVDNSGRIIADAGTIAMQAETVNIGGLVQADSIRERNGIIELVASENLTVSAGANISARGGADGTSPGGQVTLNSGDQFRDEPTSTITVAGGIQGGHGGQVEISATDIPAIRSHVDGGAAVGWLRGQLLLDPVDIILSASGAAASSGNVGVSDLPDTLTLNPGSFSSFSQIHLQASRNITLNSFWNLPDSSDLRSRLILQAGNNVTFNSSLFVGRNWAIDVIAGADFRTPASVISGTGGIYVNGSSFLQTENGSISLLAGKEIKIQTGRNSGGIRTVGGGSIVATALSGDINTGNNPNGYLFNSSSVGYDVSAGALGGISTAAGGDVTFTAGRDITSFFPSGTSGRIGDGGSGAFGPEPGVVTVTAGRNVYGHFVAANSERGGRLVASSITALNGNAGISGNLLSLSLIRGGWNVSAPHGSIYLQEVRNPNGMFNGLRGSSDFHRFDYDPRSFVNLNAGVGIDLVGALLPRLQSDNLLVLYPPSLTISAGAGGLTLGSDVTLFPSPYGDLHITTTGGGSLEGNAHTLTMSDSGRMQWLDRTSFNSSDHAASPVQLNNPNPVLFDIAGNLDNLTIIMPKQTRITVRGEMDDSSFYGQNLHAGDVTLINVTGRIWNRNLYTFAYLTQLLPLVGINPNLPPDYFQVLTEAVTSTGGPLFPFGVPFAYNPATGRLAYRGVMNSDIEQLLLGTLQVRTYGPDGRPLRDLQGNYLTRPMTFALSPAVIQDIFERSQAGATMPVQSGYMVGGPGQFNITAASLDLGASQGIVSQGPGLNPALARLPGTGTGASITIDLTHGDLNMYASQISSLFGGSISIFVEEGAVNLGASDLPTASDLPRGIYTVGHSDVSVIARGDIEVEGSRIAAYNGGNVLVRSLEGDVNAGSGGNGQVIFNDLPVVDPVTFAVTRRNEVVAGSGILATTLPDAPAWETVGNIRVETPRGDIIASSGGIAQDPLNGNLSLEPTVTLIAGTRDAAGNIVYHGNIDASGSGVIGVNTTLNAAGNISGLVVASGNANINAAANVTGTFFAAGTANFNTGGNVSGTVIAGQGINSSGASFRATAFSQNVTVGGTKGESALASSATASTTSQAAAQSSEQDTAKTVAQAKVGSEEDDALNKRLGKSPVLKKSVGRVTVILPPS